MTRSPSHSRLARVCLTSCVITLTAVSCSRQPVSPNLVLIVVDTLRADRLSLYGNGRLTSPHLDAWATSEAIVFDEVVAAAPLTLPAHVSMFSGLDAHRHGVNHDGVVPRSIPLLASILQEAGYSTSAVTGGGYLHPRYGLDRGFDHFFFWSGDPIDPSETELESNIKRALEVLDTVGPDPFFLFFHTYEVHEPYLPRSPFFEEFHGNRPPPVVRLDHHRERGPSLGFVDQRRLGILEAGHPGSWLPLPPELHQLPIDLYDSSVAFTDHHLSGLLQRLQEMDNSRPTLVVFTSDHGEMLGEQGLGGHVSLESEALLVPLIMALPDGLGAGTRFESPSRSTDILPTILDILGLPVPPAIDGVSLLPALTRTDGAGARPFPAAWSYASKPNLGLVVRQGGGLRVHLNHTVWEPGRSDARVWRETDEPVGPEESGDSRAQTALALIATTVERLEQEIPGLRIRMRNPGPETVSGELYGQAIHPARIKSLDLPCACVTWLDDHRARFEVPALTTYTLILEQVAGRRLEVLLDRPQNGFFELDLTELGEVRSVVYDHPIWDLVEGELDNDTTAISFWWRGGLPEPEVIVETELQDRLRRLGYLN